MVRETLNKALEDAVGYYNEGLSANDAIVKSASEHDLTIDQTDRVVESFNTAKTINYFDKNASDRTGSFDLASKKDVTLRLFGKSSLDKKAECKVSDPGSIRGEFYSSEPDRFYNRKTVFTLKRANYLDKLAAEAEERWAHGYSDRTFQDMASDAYSVVKSAEKDIADAIGTIDSYLCSATEKIAADLASGPYEVPEDRANLFKAACPHPLVIREVSRICPLLKNASGGKYARMAVIDTTSVDELLKEADDIMSAVEQRKVYRQKRAEFAGKARKVKEAMLRDPSISGKVSRASTPESMIHAPSEKRAASNISTSDILSTLVAVESRSDNNEAMRDEARGAMLADLMSSDPILMEADPRQVAAIYKSIIATSPRVSLNKEVVRSVLRGAVNSIALSPNDTKVLTDVDKGIGIAYGQPAGKDE